MSDDQQEQVVSFLTPGEERRAAQGKLYQDRQSARKRRHREATRASRAARDALSAAASEAPDDALANAAAAGAEDAPDVAAAAAAGDFDAALAAATEAERRAEAKAKTARPRRPRRLESASLRAKKARKPSKPVGEGADAASSGGEGDESGSSDVEPATRARGGKPRREFADALGDILASGTSKRKQRKRPRKDEDAAAETAEAAPEERKPAVDPLSALSQAATKRLRAERAEHRAALEKTRVRRTLMNKSHEKASAWDAGEEMRLRRVATRGVVGLFNEVARYQFESAAERRAGRERRREKDRALGTLKRVAPEDVRVGLGGAMLPSAAVTQDREAKELTKDAFFQMLAKPKGEGEARAQQGVRQVMQQIHKQNKAEVAAAHSGGWGALKEDYMLGAVAHEDDDGADASDEN